MYAPPNSGSVAARTVGPAIGALCCGACFLFLIAATIILALIPVYTPTKTATLNPNARKSQDITATIDFDGASSGRRKRQAVPPSNLTSYVGGKFGPYGNTLVENG
ncbi:unnamed protein product, partial [Rotaria sordida]